MSRRGRVGGDGFYRIWTLDPGYLHLRGAHRTLGQAEFTPEGKETSSGTSHAFVFCAHRTNLLLWALVGRAVSFQMYSTVNMLFCFLHSIE